MPLEEARVPLRDPPVHPDAEVDPVAQQIAVVGDGGVRIAVTRVGFVVAAAGAEVADAAGLARASAAVLRGVEKRAEPLAVDPVFHVAEARQRRSREPVAEVEAALAID